nr:reverse transcriptase domain-containing protein [Tanacetum cinerariifolium]
MVKNELRNEMKTSIQTSLSNQTNEIKNMMASLLQMNTASTSGSGTLLGNTIANPKGELKAITTRSGLVTEGPTIPNPPKSVNQEEDECVEETYTDPDHAEYNIKVPPPPPVQKPKPPIQRNFVLHTRDSLPPPVILKKLPEKLRDPRKFLIPCGFSELKCKALTDLGTSINLMPLSVWKKLGLPDLIPTQMTLELANRAICTPDGIARDVFVPVGKFTFLADFVVVDYESDPRVPLILGRPFLRIARALIDVHGEEMILRDGDERKTLWIARALIDVHGEEMILRDGDDRLTLNMRHDTSSYSNQPQKESINLINVFNISIPLILLLLTHCLRSSPDIYSSLKDLIDQSNLADNFVDSMLEMFTDEHALDYLSPLIFDEYDDDFLEVESDNENVYNDPFDSKGEKIKESKLLIDELDLPCDFLPPSEYDSFISQDFFRVDALPSTNNEDKLATSNASLMLEDFDPPLYEPLFFKEFPSTTYSSNSLLEEFTDELALITYPPDYDDNLTCDIESDLMEIEFFLYQGKDSYLKDSIDQTDLANLDDLFVDPTPEMFTDEHAPDYSFPLRFDVYYDDFLEIESDADNFYDDPFDSKGKKIKESELLVDELDLPCDILPYS